MKKFLLLTFIIFIASSSFSQITWAENVAPILYENCTSCHHNGGIAPFSLITYEEAEDEDNSIADEVEDGHMPPWPADSLYQQYAHQRTLNQEEINTLVQWVEQGSLMGDLSLAPPPPVYSEDGYINLTPDLELIMPVYTSNATSNSDDYSCFALPSGLLQDKKLRAYEVIPGNSSIVHHALVFVDADGTYQTNTSGFCMGPEEGLIGGYTPGAVPTVFPSNGTDFNLGVAIPSGSNIVLAMHYPEGSQGMEDQTKIRLWFYPDATVIREVETSSILQNWSFVLPANQFTEVNAEFNFIPVDASVLSVFPHMHLLGESIESYAITPLNDTIPFVRINQWDFHWQQFYFFKNLLRVPAWSNMIGKGIYNNTASNPHNPNSPPQTVTAGLNTTDEMFLIYFQFLPYMAGDELQDLEELTQMTNPLSVSELDGIKGLKVFPNPAIENTTFELNLDNASTVSLYIYGASGKLIEQVAHQEQLSIGTHLFNWEIDSKINSGSYFYSLNVNGTFSSGKVVVMKK